MEQYLKKKKGEIDKDQPKKPKGNQEQKPKNNPKPNE
jgi:hypothetical protein